MKGLSSQQQREWGPGSSRKLSLPDFLRGQAKTEPRRPLAQWVPRLPRALAAHLGPRSPSTATSPGGALPGQMEMGQVVWQGCCVRQGPGSRLLQGVFQPRWAPSRGFPSCVLGVLGPRAPRPLRSYLEPWERRCPGRPRTWVHVTGRSGVRPGQGAATGGRSCPGHGLRRLLGQGGRDWRWGGPEARGRRLRAGAGAPCQLRLRPRWLGTRRLAPCERQARLPPSPRRGARAGGRARARAGGERAAGSARAAVGGGGEQFGSCPWC